eukprot:CAMPEP_0113300430 /NCGR_PEP_ID=MMETSP0010_2-20120614/2066_1 /TAXON_ID=216773 ORGANISM="Corethron hystrix, Strain 308" /NCGR_SAMPLE_ID=MMETSP0010_2 /ASSEMBLY_ACC=CAM_ASM_000155 /LENGTH=394 /DNA_ID=CAMNT_0000153859 /DNA_START=63 /DNA_END=1244 /DNA_ORIENTATION=- /assembly_acc=CAM_ASM_000155
MGSWIRALSSCIVRHAPCFWCSLCSPPLDVHATDRAILFRLNVLVMFFASCQIFSGLSLLLLMFGGQLRPEQNGTSVQCVGHVNATSPGVRSILHGVANWDGLVDLDEQEFMSSWAPVAQGEENDIESGNIFFPSLWNLKFVVVFIGLVGLIILVFSSLAVKTIKEVILADAMRLYWLLVWVLPVELFFVANLFDIHSVTNTVIVHMWHKRSFFLIREQMCGRESCAQHEGLPISTAETKCKVPIFPRDTEEAFRQQVDAWCHEEYQSENCYDILHAAQQKFLLVTKAFYCVNIAIGFFLVVLLYLTMRSLREVISRPIVQRSTIANIPAGFIVPIIGSLYMAFLLLSKNSIVEHQQYCGWIGKVYLVSAGTFFIAALLSRYIAMASVMNCADK